MELIFALFFAIGLLGTIAGIIWAVCTFSDFIDELNKHRRITNDRLKTLETIAVAKATK